MKEDEMTNEAITTVTQKLYRAVRAFKVANQKRHHAESERDEARAMYNELHNGIVGLLPMMTADPVSPGRTIHNVAKVIERNQELEAENARLLTEIEIVKHLVCPTCNFPVEEINRNGLYIAARCDWCNEVVHIEKE
jgi:hypothetical protein